MKRVLVLRFSAMGDVLTTLPVLESLARRYPEVRVTLCSRGWVRPLVELLPSNVDFVEAELKGAHRGFRGLMRLAWQLMRLRPTMVADLHDVLRTKVLRWMLLMTGVRTAHLHKDRSARKDFIISHGERALPTVFSRYKEVFRHLGLPLGEIDFHSLFPPQGVPLATIAPWANTEKWVEPFWVAIAPFATHTGKIYPIDKMEQVVAALAQRTDVRVFLFGAGSQEQTVLEDWAKRYPQTESVAGKAEGLQQEAALVSHCKVMVSMDSANMHLASLVAVPVVSIWGATHPQGGFLGYGQTMQNVIQRDDLACRPCSIFGKTSCRWGDYRCLAGISPQMVVDKINEFLK